MLNDYVARFDAMSNAGKYACLKSLAPLSGGGATAYGLAKEAQKHDTRSGYRATFKVLARSVMSRGVSAGAIAYTLNAGEAV